MKGPPTPPKLNCKVKIPSAPLTMTLRSRSNKGPHAQSASRRSMTKVKIKSASGGKVNSRIIQALKVVAEKKKKLETPPPTELKGVNHKGRISVKSIKATSRKQQILNDPGFDWLSRGVDPQPRSLYPNLAPSPTFSHQEDDIIMKENSATPLASSASQMESFCSKPATPSAVSIAIATSDASTVP